MDEPSFFKQLEIASKGGPPAQQEQPLPSARKDPDLLDLKLQRRHTVSHKRVSFGDQGLQDSINKAVEKFEKKFEALEKRLEERFTFMEDENDCRKEDIVKNTDDLSTHAESLEGFGHKYDLLEKLLSFQKMNKTTIQMEKCETMVRDILEEAVRPSQRRVIQLQDRFADISQMHIDLKARVDHLSREMYEALGVGKMTLKQTIMVDVQKFQQQTTNEVTEKLAEFNHTRLFLEKMQKHMEQRIEIWKAVQEDNALRITNLQSDLHRVEKEAHEALNRRMNLADDTHNQMVKRTEEVRTMLEEHDRKVEERLEVIQEFREQLLVNQERMEKNEFRMMENEKNLLEFQEDDIFKSAWSNFTKVYNEVIRIEKKVDVDLRREIKDLGYNMDDYAKVVDINHVNARVRDAEEATREAEDRLNYLEEQFRNFQLKVEEVKSQVSTGGVAKPTTKRRVLERQTTKYSQISDDVSPKRTRRSPKKEAFQLAENQIALNVRPTEESEKKSSHQSSPLGLLEKKLSPLKEKSGMEIDTKVDIKEAYATYSNWRKDHKGGLEGSPVPGGDHQCKFDPEVLKDFIGYDEAGQDYISDMIQEQINEFEEEVDEKITEAIDEVKGFFKEQLDQQKEQTATKLMALQKKSREAVQRQDDIIDVLSRELHKEAKKKSDQDLKIQDLIDSVGTVQKKLNTRMEALQGELKLQAKFIEQRSSIPTDHSAKTHNRFRSRVRPTTGTSADHSIEGPQILTIKREENSAQDDSADTPENAPVQSQAALQQFTHFFNAPPQIETGQLPLSNSKMNESAEFFQESTETNQPIGGDTILNIETLQSSATHQRGDFVPSQQISAAAVGRKLKPMETIQKQSTKTGGKAKSRVQSVGRARPTKPEEKLTNDLKGGAQPKGKKKTKNWTAVSKIVTANKMLRATKPEQTSGAKGQKKSKSIERGRESSLSQGNQPRASQRRSSHSHSSSLKRLELVAKNDLNPAITSIMQTVNAHESRENATRFKEFAPASSRSKRFGSFRQDSHSSQRHNSFSVAGMTEFHRASGKEPQRPTTTKHMSLPPTQLFSPAQDAAALEKQKRTQMILQMNKSLEKNSLGSGDAMKSVIQTQLQKKIVMLRDLHQSGTPPDSGRNRPQSITKVNILTSPAGTKAQKDKFAFIGNQLGSYITGLVDKTMKQQTTQSSTVSNLASQRTTMSPTVAEGIKRQLNQTPEQAKGNNVLGLASLAQGARKNADLISTHRPPIGGILGNFLMSQTSKEGTSSKETFGTLQQSSRPAGVGFGPSGMNSIMAQGSVSKK